MPNGGLEKVGVELVVEGFGRFQGELELATELINKLGGKSGATEQAAKSTSQFAKVAGILPGKMGAVASQAAGAGSALKAVGAVVSSVGVGTVAAVAGLAALAVGFIGLAVVTVKATKALIEFGKSSIVIAGQVDQATRMALYLGQTMGYTQEQVQSYIDNIIDLGIRADVAANLVAKFSQRQLDLAQTTELAAAAQNVAKLASIDSSDALERLNAIIATGDKEMARTIGLEINFIAAQDELARSLDTTRQQLAPTEIAQANLNAVLAQAANLSGVYAAAQGSPTAALSSLQRQIFNVQAELGKPFLEAWYTVITALRDFVSAVSDAIGEGGRLRPILINLGAVASIAADAFAGFVGIFTDMLTTVDDAAGTFGGLPAGVARGMSGVVTAVDEGTTSTIDTLSQWASDALQWGIEFVASLAEGIVQGASSALIAAMNFIGSVLTSWLGPGSPPAVAPGLTDWGVAAMTEYLKGFTEADFSVLKAVQGPLQQILGRPEFAAVTQQLTFELATGGVDESFFNVIAQAAGEFGTEVAELARRQHALALATTAVETAERRLESTRKAQKKAQADVGRLAREYNELLRESASKDVLDAKMAELKAAEDRVAVTAQQALEAEAETEAAQAQQVTLEEQLVLQKQLVDQLMLVAGAQQETSRTTETATGRATQSVRGLGEELRGLTGAMPTAAEFDIASRIGAAIDEAKQALQRRMATLFKPLLDAWKTVQKRFEEVEETFEWFLQVVSLTWEKVKEDFTFAAELIEVLLTETLPAAFEWTKQSLLTVLKPAFVTVRDYLVNQFIPPLRDLANIYLAAINRLVERMAHLWEHTLLPALRTVRDWIADHLRPLFDTTVPGSFGAVLAWFVNDILTGFGTTLHWVVGLVQALINWIGTLIQAILNALALFDELRGVIPDVNPNADVPSGDTSVRGRAARTDRIPIIASPVPVLMGGAQAAMSTMNEWNLNVGPNTLHRPLDIDMLAAVIERRLMRSMRI